MTEIEALLVVKKIVTLVGLGQEAAAAETIRALEREAAGIQVMVADVARERGWSEAMNCTPWHFLGAELKIACENLKLAQDTGVAKLEQWRQMTFDAQSEQATVERTLTACIGHLADTAHELEQVKRAHEKRRLLWDEWDAKDRQKTREINILIKENKEMTDALLDFLSTHTTDCAGEGECVCDKAWPLVGLKWGDVEGARRRLRVKRD